MWIVGSDNVDNWQLSDFARKLNVRKDKLLVYLSVDNLHSKAVEIGKKGDISRNTVSKIRSRIKTLTKIEKKQLLDYAH